jgi:hypothetical protein
MGFFSFFLFLVLFLSHHKVFIKKMFKLFKSKEYTDEELLSALKGKLFHIDLNRLKMTHRFEL